MVKLPSISIVSPTYNCDLKIFKESLESIKMQDYPKNLIEDIRADGGSQNKTVELARSYGSLVIERPDLQGNSQARMKLAIKKSKNELILILESDNILVGRDWLKKMVTPLMENNNIFCTYSAYNGYKKNMPLLTRYFALLGTNDAFLYYLGKVEKMSLDKKDSYDKGEILEEHPSYYVVKFTPENLPPMGDNGFMIRRKVILSVINNTKDFIHVDAFSDLVARGHDTFGVVKNSIIHYSGSNIIKQYKNRVLIKKIFYDERRGERSYLTFNPGSQKDRQNLIKFVFLSATFIIPLARSLRGYMRVREAAWFLHPVVCLVALFMYTISEINFLISNYGKRP